jgi:translocation and assembly module TamB
MTTHKVFSEEPDPRPRRQNNHGHRGWRIFGWSILGLIGFIVAIIVFAVVSINTDGVHRAILNFAQRQASSALGVRVQLQNFTVHWSTLSVDLYGISVDGAGPHPNPPLLRADRVEAGVRIVSVFQRKWYFKNLRIDHPVAWVYVDRNGVSNIPAFKKSGGSNNNESFDLGIRHAVINRGEAYYNSRPSAIAADLHNLDLRVTYDPPRQMYSGRLAYSDGHLKYGAYRPIPHNLDATFSLTPATLQLDQAKLSSGDSQALLSATIHDYVNNPAVHAQYRIAVDGQQFAKLLNNRNIPTGFIHASGDIQYQNQPHRPPIQSVELNGDLTSDRLDVNTATTHAQIANLNAHYSLANGNATLHDLRAALLGGEISAQGTMTNLGGDSHSNFTAVVRNVSLAALQRQAGESAAEEEVALTGTVNASASAKWGKTIDDLVVHADGGIQADVSGREQPEAQAANNPVVPINSEIHATYTRSNNQFALTQSYLRTQETELKFDGTVGQHSTLAIRLQANDLRELATVVNSFHPPAPGRQPLDLAGTASFQGNVQGTVSAPHITGELTAMNLHVNGSDWKLIRTGVDVGPDHAIFQNAELNPATRGHIALNARADLNKWTFDKQSPLQIQLNASQIDIAELTRFTGKKIPVAGTLNTRVNLHGTATNPEGSGDLMLTRVNAYQERIQSIRVDFSGNGDQARANLSVEMPAGHVQGNITVQPKQRTYTAQITSPGIQLDRVVALQARHIKANGNLALNVNGEGSFDNPELAATIQSPSLTVSNQTITALKLQLNVANHVANATLSSTAMHAPVAAKATVHLTGDYQADASINTPVIELQPLLAVYAPDEADDFSGQTQVQATLHGPLKNLRQLEAQVTIPVLKLAYQNSVQLAAAQPIQVNYRDGILDVPQGAIRGTGTDLQFRAHVPMNSDQPMSLQLRGAVDLHIAQLFSPDIRSAGQLKLNIDSNGAVAKGANLGGEIDIVDASITTADLPVGLQHGNGVLKLTTDHVNVESFNGTIGGGTVTMRGGIAYRPQLSFALSAEAKGVRMLYPTGLRENADASIRLDGTTKRAVLGGTVDVTSLSFTPAFDTTSFVNQLGGGVAAPPSQGIAQNIRLNLAVRTTNEVNLVNREVSLDGSADLQVRGTVADPVILGRVNLTGGDIILAGNRYELSGGTIQFVNPAETEPVLNLSLTTMVQEYEIQLRLQGPVTQMRTEYSSNPALPSADIIHLIAFGSTSEAAANNATPGNQQAESLLAGQVANQVTSRISRATGISQLSINPVLQGGTAQGPTGANITIRQRVTSNLYVTFSTNVSTTQDQVFQGQYQISPRVAISATRDQNGGFGVDTLIKKKW